jgi:flagellar capping protein FliD
MMGETPMRVLMVLGFTVAALLAFAGPARAQEQAFQKAVLQKLDALDGKISSLENRLNDMDKRYEVRFTMLEGKLDALDERFNERFNALNIRMDAINQRIDDKFNLLVGLLALVAAFLGAAQK